MQTAWDAGYQAGLHEAASSDTRAAESASADLAQGLHTLQAVIEAIQAEQTTLLHVSERAVIELASAVASKVVQRTVEADDDLVVRSVREALRCLNRVNRLTLRVHPADLRVVESFQPEFSVLLDTTCAITVVEDASVSRGGCIMDTDAGAIDARIATRLSEIKLALLSACDMDQNPRHEPGADDMTPEMELAV
jgi:flagellar assembly protein FliH